MKQEDFEQLLLKEISWTEMLIDEFKEMSGPVACIAFHVPADHSF